MIKEYQKACKFTLAYQTFIALFLAMLLDGGQLFQFWFISMLAYIVSVAIIMAKQHKTVNKSDLLYLKFGSLILLFISPLIITFIWRLKGVI